jgi:hypothetical protein
MRYSGTPDLSVVDFIFPDGTAANFSSFDSSYGYDSSHGLTCTNSRNLEITHRNLAEHVTGTYQHDFASRAGTARCVNAPLPNSSTHYVGPTCNNKECTPVSHLSSSQPLLWQLGTVPRRDIHICEINQDLFPVVQDPNPGFTYTDLSNCPTAVSVDFSLFDSSTFLGSQQPNHISNTSSTAQVSGVNEVTSSVPLFPSTSHGYQNDRLAGRAIGHPIYPIPGSRFSTDPLDLEGKTSTATWYPQFEVGSVNLQSPRVSNKHRQLLNEMGPKGVSKKIKKRFRKKGRACGICAEQRVKVGR